MGAAEGAVGSSEGLEPRRRAGVPSDPQAHWWPGAP